MEQQSTEMEKVKSTWLNPLRELVVAVNEKFSCYFRQMGCAGQVRLHEHETVRSAHCMWLVAGYPTLWCVCACVHAWCVCVHSCVRALQHLSFWFVLGLQSVWCGDNGEIS